MSSWSSGSIFAGSRVSRAAKYSRTSSAVTDVVIVIPHTRTGKGVGVKNWSTIFAGRESTVECHAREHADFRAWQQDLVVRERDVVADGLVQQVVADEADRDLADASGIVLQPLGLAQLHLEIVVALGRRLSG